jgi:hypothetical protein
MPPNLTEIATTTVRNRGAKKMNKDAKKHGVAPKQWKESGAAKFEDSPKDKREDVRLAKQHGMTLKQWEGSAEDRRHDVRKAVKNAVTEVKKKSK